MWLIRAVKIQFLIPNSLECTLVSQNALKAVLSNFVIVFFTGKIFPGNPCKFNPYDQGTFKEFFWVTKVLADFALDRKI